MDIYESLEKPIISLAPMEDVTDTVFRNAISHIQRPDLFYTEFVNVDGLNSKGKEKVLHRLKHEKSERPIIVQLWGSNPENFFKSAQMVGEMGFAGIDINMGCSVKKVSGHGSGSGLILSPGLAIKIIKSTREGAGDLPVSVKTRLGWDFVDIEWIYLLLKQNIRALTIHCRTARGKDAINANWSYMEEVVKLRDSISPSTLLFGNGDLLSVKQAKSLVKEYRLDGAMIGRAVISNPWIFSGKEEISQKERYDLFKYHLEMFDKVWGESKDFNGLKKFFRAYIKDFDGANELRQQFMNCKDVGEALELLKTIS
jgi:nifR3 family TIM-barrel protein